MRMGVKLGEKILRLRPDHDIDTIIPIPDSARDSALEVANVLGVKYREGFIKNRYVGRTFIMPGQGERVKSVRRKLNPIPLEFRNRVVLLVDDSTRGTSRRIVQMARDAGARKVIWPAAPPVRHPNIYGIDMPAANNCRARPQRKKCRPRSAATGSSTRIWLIWNGPWPKATTACTVRFLLLHRRIRHRPRANT